MTESYPYLVPTLALVAVLGSVFGSFANVAIYRVPLGKSVIAALREFPSG